MRFNLKEKTGFKCKGGAVLVNDTSGRPFYHFKKNDPFTFNLPAGVYDIKGDIEKLAAPIDYVFYSSRKREHNHELPEAGQLKILYATNPNKASIFPKKHVIILDKGFENAPKVIKDYLIFHEIGHYFYKTEKFADEFAQEQLIKKGYPFSLIVKAAEKTLFNGHERHRFCYENMKKIKVRK